MCCLWVSRSKTGKCPVINRRKIPETINRYFTHSLSEEALSMFKSIAAKCTKKRTFILKTYTFG